MILSVYLWELFSRFESAKLVQQQTLLILGFGWFALQLIAAYLQSIAEMFKYMLINNISIKRDMYCLLLTILKDSKMI